MKSKDVLNAEKQEIVQKLNAAIKEENMESFSNDLTKLYENVEQSILAEAHEIMRTNETAVLAARGTRQLTTEETNYYQKVSDAMRGTNPKQALADLEEVMPKTVIDSVFEDLVDAHPLLNFIDFQNTSGLIEWILNNGNPKMATWSPLTAEIVKELTGGFKKVALSLNKLSAFLPISKSMLDLGPIWLDCYIRTLLQESIYLGLEEAIINGTGKDMPIGMNRQVGDGVTITGGVYPLKPLIPVTNFDPETYGQLLSTMAVTPNGRSRVVTKVLMVVNPIDYLSKVMPASTVRGADGTYINNAFPFPTEVIQSVEIEAGKAIIGLIGRYFMGVGTAQSGKIEFSDEYKFLEDERVYLIKLYGHGEPKDNTAFVYADISGLKPTLQAVTIKGTVETKEKA